MAYAGRLYDLQRLSPPDHDGRHWASYHAIRAHALPEGCAPSHPDDPNPEAYGSTHHALLLSFAGRAIGAAQLADLRDGSGIVRALAIAPDMRGKGHGRALSAHLDRYTVRLGIEALLVCAPAAAERFFSATGWYRADWDPSQVSGVGERCVQMRKIFDL